MKSVTIEYSVNMASLFEGTGWEDVNEEVSGDNYRLLLDRALQNYHSGYSPCVIEVTESAGNDKVYVEVNGEDATDAERPFVEGVAADVYADFEWVVYNETEWECPACLHLNTEAGETVFPFCAVCGTEKEG